MDLNRVDRAKAAPNPAMAGWFEGNVRFQQLVQGGDTELLVVYFETNARTRPHIHNDDQTLYFVEGEGVVATENDIIHAKAGDFVTIPAGVWHWHGAAQNAATVHISIKRPGATNWDVEEKNWATAQR
ncbi:MAG TPA: cupin domain-containing protein [Ktedonobacterales bacterium]|nr:cupin domain-containing protein [Ktedonobacterales bacterium]